MTKKGELWVTSPIVPGSNGVNNGRARMRVPKIAKNGFKSVLALLYYGLF